jgi:hypothetical protein
LEGRLDKVEETKFELVKEDFIKDSEDMREDKKRGLDSDSCLKLVMVKLVIVVGN